MDHEACPVTTNGDPEGRILLNAGQKYCREHSAILSTFTKLQFAIKTFVLPTFEWLLSTGFTVCLLLVNSTLPVSSTTMVNQNFSS